MELETAICSNGVKVLLNMDELRNSTNLKNACIFNRLFGFDNEEFKKEDFKRNTNGHVTIFQDYNISSKEVLNFLYFVRYGKIRYKICMDFMEAGGDKQKAYTDLYFQEIDNIVTTGVFLKFGPFPEFDMHIEKMLKSVKQEKINRIKNKMNETNSNPMTPQQDRNKLYYWISYHTIPSTTPYPPNSKNVWEVTVKVDGQASYMYYRCEKLPEQL